MRQFIFINRAINIERKYFKIHTRVYIYMSHRKMLEPAVGINERATTGD